MSSYTSRFPMLFTATLCLALCQALSSTGWSQETPRPATQVAQKSELPLEWHGQWEGEVTMQSGGADPQSFQMQLTIATTDAANKWEWTIVYDGVQGKSTRPYLLVAEEKAAGQFVIDEQNGIRINAALLGDSLSSHFSVQGQQLWSSYRLVRSEAGDAIYFELFSAPEATATTSGGQNEVPEVKSLKPTSRQFAVLKRAAKASSSDVADKAAMKEAQSELPAWRKLTTEPYRGKQDDIYFVNENVGWYVNGAGKIFRTQDGGATWQLQLDQPGTFFRCVAFIDEQHGFAGNIGPGYFPGVTDSVPLYETTDSGVTWKAVTTIEGEPVVGLCALQVLKEEFVNAGNLDTRTRLIGVGRVGGPTAMIVSDDAGATWQQVPLKDHAAMAFDVHFFNRLEGFVAAATDADVAKSNALILSTVDGGKTWKRAWQSDRAYELTWKITFPTRNVGYVTIQSYNPDPSVSQRFVAKTIDGGKTWSEVPLVSDAKVREFGIAFLDENIGWVGATPNGFQTTDGGATWQAVEMGNAVNKIRLLKSESQSVGYAIGVNVYRIDIPKK